jgi:BTB/POZ domain
VLREANVAIGTEEAHTPRRPHPLSLDRSEKNDKHQELHTVNITMADETKKNEEISPSICKEISHHEMLACFLTADYLNDAKLKGTDGVEVAANRFLLAARSDIFQAMFFGEFNYVKCPTVELGFQSNLLRAVVEYIVTDSIQQR